MATIIYAPGLDCCQTKVRQVILQCLVFSLLDISQRRCLGFQGSGIPKLLSEVSRQLIPRGDRVSPKFVEPTLGRASKSYRKQHAPKLGVHVARSDVRNAIRKYTYRYQV